MSRSNYSTQRGSTQPPTLSAKPSRTPLRQIAPDLTSNIVVADVSSQTIVTVGCDTGHCDSRKVADLTKLR
ncbi:MAG: hypothetical protein WA919_14855 [Coleofasciculaceae cyanobacterium]